MDVTNDDDYWRIALAGSLTIRIHQHERQRSSWRERTRPGAPNERHAPTAERTRRRGENELDGTARTNSGPSAERTWRSHSRNSCAISIGSARGLSKSRSAEPWSRCHFGSLLTYEARNTQ